MNIALQLVLVIQHSQLMALVLLIVRTSRLIAAHQPLLLITQVYCREICNFGDLVNKRLRQTLNCSDVVSSNPGCGVLMRSQKI